MSFERQTSIFIRHALAIVRHTDSRNTAPVANDVTPLRSRIQSVLEQFLGCTRRPLNNLTGGNLTG
jgi:hypothetical protein